MNLRLFSTISITCFTNFLMFLSLCILMISWSTCSCYLNTENMYTWYLNVWRKLSCNVISKMQVLCDRSYLSWFNHFLWWYQDEFCEDESDHQLRESQQCSWCTIISWFYEFLLMIYKTFLKNCMIFVNLIKKNTKFL